MCQYCSLFQKNNELKLIEALDWYGRHFGIEPSGAWSQQFDQSITIGLLRESMLSNMPVPDYLYDTYKNEKYRHEKFEWHQAIKRYMDYFELKVPHLNKWKHADTIRLIDQAISGNTPLADDYAPDHNA